MIFHNQCNLPSHYNLQILCIFLNQIFLQDPNYFLNLYNSLNQIIFQISTILSIITIYTFTFTVLFEVSIFSQSLHFSSSIHITKTLEFNQSLQFSQSTQFSKSIIFSEMDFLIFFFFKGTCYNYKNNYYFTLLTKLTINSHKIRQIICFNRLIFFIAMNYLKRFTIINKKN